MEMVSGSRPASDEGSMRLSMVRSYGTSAIAVERLGRMFMHMLVLGLALAMAGAALAQTPPPREAKPIKLVGLGGFLSARAGPSASSACPARRARTFVSQ